MLPVLLSAITAGGALLGAVGKIKQGEAAAKAGEFNAEIAEQNAADTLVLGAEEERRVRVMARKTIGQARASIGASGIQADASALDVLQESAANAEMDAISIRYQTYKKAQTFKNDAALARMGGGAGLSSSLFGAAGSILTGINQTAGYYGGGEKKLPVEGP